jgi:hypothetical protein
MDVLLIDCAGLHAQHVRPVDRFLSWSRGATLDGQLADGVDPESNVGLAVRAQLLVRPSQRRRLARGLRRVLTTAQASPGVRTRAPVQVGTVSLARADLETLADRLLQPGPVNVRGVARTKVLLGDGSGPLYLAGSRDLGSELRSAAAALASLI